MRVLVVEDEEALGAVFRDFLYELGHQPVVVRTAEAALGQMTTQRPDAIILDINLPGMSGLDFLQLRPVRESGLPIVAISGVVSESQARECLKLGALDFVGKPVELERLTEVLTFLEPHALNRRHDDPRADRRRSLRARVGLPLRITEYSGAVWSGTCVELAVGGLKAQSDARLSRGTAVKLEFTPPDGGAAIDVMALVVRVDRDGAAFAFVHMPGTQIQRLSGLIPRLAGH